MKTITLHVYQPGDIVKGWKGYSRINHVLRRWFRPRTPEEKDPDRRWEHQTYFISFDGGQTAHMTPGCQIPRRTDWKDADLLRMVEAKLPGPYCPTDPSQTEYDPLLLCSLVLEHTLHPPKGKNAIRFQNISQVASATALITRASLDAELQTLKVKHDIIKAILQ